MPHAVESDADRLQELGYTQELRRSWGLLQNFGVSFAIISTISGISTLFEYGLTTGGPAVMTSGWIIVCSMTMFVAAGMAEIVSAVPTSGGPYYWAAILAPRSKSAFYAWLTGWFNFLGQVAVTTSITYGLAGIIVTTASIDGTFVNTPAKQLGIFAGLLVSHGLINTFGGRILGIFNNISIVLHSVGIFSLAVAVVAKAPTHQSVRFVFAKFYDGTGVDGAVGWSMRASPAYVACIGILMAQYTITGFDASAHLAEETHNAAKSAPIGVLLSVGVSAIFGFFIILCFLFSVQDFDTTIASPYGSPIVQIFVDAAGPTGAKALMAIIIITVWHCGLFSLTSNSRMMYAFARDGGIPRFFAHVNDKLEVPTRTIWLGAFLSFCLALPSLGSAVAFSAATSIATIGLYISYGLPIFLGMIYHEQFKLIRGPFSLGKASRPIALIASAWVVFITIIFCLPELNPATSQTLNYAPVATGIVLGGALLSWFAFARKNFKGPLAAMVENGAIDSDAANKLGLAQSDSKRGDDKFDGPEQVKVRSV